MRNKKNTCSKCGVVCSIHSSDECRECRKVTCRSKECGVRFSPNLRLHKDFCAVCDAKNRAKRKYEDVIPVSLKDIH